MKKTILPKPEAGYTGYVEEEHHHDYAGDTVFGFWLYILSDCILFASLFAVYAVLSGNFADAPTAKELIDLNFVFVETALLLFSSFTFGVAMLAANANDLSKLYKWLWITFALGAGFLGMELYEFVHFSMLGATPWSAGAWSAFYGLLGTHGLHVFFGLIWIVVLMKHIKQQGLTENNRVRLVCLSLFWHFLDIIWVCVYSVVFLVGAM